MLCLTRSAGVKANRKSSARLAVIRLILPMLLVLTGWGDLHAETAPTKVWDARYDGSLHGTDSFSSDYLALLYAMFPFVEPNFKLMAVDGSGNVYVAGATMTENLYDIVVIKFNKSNGKIAWKTVYDGGQSVSELPAGIALDTDGNVYVTGISGTDKVTSDIVTIKFKGADGSVVWDELYDSPAGFLEGPTGIAVHGRKSVYVCGFTGYTDPITKTAKFDYLTLKYTAGGAYQWAKTYDGPSKMRDIAASIALDSKGNVYVTGASTSLKTAVDIATVKYAPGGAQVWTKTYDGPSHTFDVGRAIAVDGSGGVYVTGESTKGAVQALVTLKYDNVATNKDPVWVTHHIDPKGDFYSHGRALALDAKGNLSATGDQLGNAGYEYVTIKYNPGTGKEIWAKVYNGPAEGGDDQAYAIALDSSGNVYVTGSSMGSKGKADFATVKYSASKGARRWVVRYNNKVAKNYDGGMAVAVYGGKTVYVAGESMGKDAEGESTDLDLVAIRYDQVQ